MRNIEDQLSALPRNKRKLARLLLAERGLYAEPSVNRERRYPASFEQEGLWINHQFPARQLAYNEAVAFDIQGDLNCEDLEKSLGEIVRRHESLRTTFSHSGEELFQVVSSNAREPLRSESAAGLNGPGLQERIQREIRQPFNLHDGPLWRHLLLDLAPKHHLLILTVHHIVADGWSLGVFANELKGWYEAFHDGHLPPPALQAQYSEYALRQRAKLTGVELENSLSYWAKHLLGLSRGKPRTGQAPAGRPGRRHQISLRAAQAADVERLARQEACSVFMVLLAALGLVVQMKYDEHDIPIAFDFTQRTDSAFEPLIGFFVNQVIIRLDLSSDPTFTVFLKRVREEALRAYTHREAPYSMVVQGLDKSEAGGDPFVAKLVWQDSKPGAIVMSDLNVEVMDLHNREAKFDLLLNFWGGQGIAGSIDYAEDKYRAEEVITLSEMLETTIATACRHPDKPLSRIHAMNEQTRREIARRRMEEERAVNLEKLRNAHASPVTSSSPGSPGVQNREKQGLSRELVSVRMLQANSSLSLTVEPRCEDVDLAEWGSHHHDFIFSKLRQHGAILFRNFDISSATALRRLVSKWFDRPMPYNERSSLRHSVIDGIYTSTEHPPDQEICFHNENSYASSWPLHILFCCESPPSAGGRTPISDCRAVLRRLSPRTLDRFRERGICYSRNFIPGLGYSWKDAFQIEEKAKLEDFLRQSGYQWEWRDGEVLRTTRTAPAVRKHPTGELIWFNHALLFHHTSLERELSDLLVAQVGVSGLPLHCCYGDGSEIEREVLQEIREAHEAESYAFNWRPGDALLIDNMLTAHSREKYSGDRKILTALATPQNAS